ncbi:uncharacterized protein LJ206_001900 [Theristicus caerulescens]
MDEEANAYSQPANGLLSLRKRRQVGRRQPQAAPQGSQSQASSLRGDRLPQLPCPGSSQAAGSRRAQTDSLARRGALPCNRVMQEETAPLPALLPLRRQAVAPGHAPAARPPGAASTCCKLPPLPAAPSAPSAWGRETAISTAASARQQLGPSAPGICSDRGTAAGLARRDWAHSMAVPTTARTDEGWAADGGKAPAAQPTPHPHARGGTGAAGGVPAPAFPQGDVGPGHWGRAAEHNPATPAARSKRCLNGRSLQVHEEAVVEDLAALPIEMELQELERSFLARTEHRLAELRQGVLWQQQQDGLEESELQQQEGEEQRFSPMWSGQLDVRPRQVNSFYKLWQPELTRTELQKDATSKQDALEWLEAHAPSKQWAGAARGAVPQVPAGKPRALAEEDEWEDDSDIELSQRKDIPTYNTWANLLDSELFQDQREDFVTHNIWSNPLGRHR